jgi:hypothetical protein
LVGLTLTTSTLSGAELRAIVPEKHLDLMYDHCMDCHNADTQKGKVNLEDLPLEVDTLQHAELWQKVLDVMNSGEMPPENKRQPEKVAKADFLEDLAKTMVLARKKLSDSGGQITMRRLNRREYQNTIKSLTGVSLNVESLPADGGAGSFDTVGASQFISSDQFEQYLELGRTAVDEAFARHSAMAKPSTVFRVEPEKTVNMEHLEMIKKMEERLAQVKSWMDSVDKAVKAPENEAIMAQLRQEHPDIDTHAFRIYRMSNRLKGVMELKHFGGDPDSAMNFYQLDYRTKYESLKYFAELPHNERGTYLRYTSGIVRLDIPSPKERSKLVPGKYKLRFKAGIVEGTPIERHFIEVGHPRRTSPVPSGFANPPLSVHQVTGTIENPQVIESIVEVSIDGPKEFGIQERMPKDFKARIQKHHADRRKNGHGTPPAIWVDWIELEGPIQDGAVQTFRVEPEETVNVMSANWMKQLEKTHQRYLSWKAGVDKAALAPENQQALEKIRKKYNLTDLTNSIRLYQNADLLKGVPDAKNFGFKDSNDAEFSFRGGYDRMYAYQKHYSELPLSDSGTYLKLGWGFQRIVISPPADKLAPGEYKLRIRAGSVIGSDPNRHYIQIGYPQRNNDVPAGFAGKPISGHQVNGTTENPEIIETIVKIGSGNPNEFAIQERQPEDRDTYRKQFYRIKKENGYGYPPAVWIDWAELEGPIKDKQIIESSITRVEPEKTINPANEKIIKKAEATQDRFKQWKKGVDEAAKSPENQAIIAEIRKKNRLIDHPNRFYIFAEHFKNVPNPKDFGFLDFQKAAAADPSRSKNLALLKHYASLPHRDTGTYLKLTHGTGRVIVAPKKMPVGDYIFRVRLGTVKGTPAARKFIEIGHPQRDIESRDWGLKGKPISVHQVTGTIEAPQIMEIPIEVRSDTTREFAVQEKQPNNANLKALWNEHNQLKAENGYGHPPAIWIDWVELEGPHDPNRPKTWKQRREVEHHANAKVGGTYNDYFKGGHDKAQAFLKTGKPQKDIVDEDRAQFFIREFENKGPSYRRYLDSNLTKSGSLLGFSYKQEFIALPPEHPSGWSKTQHIVDTLPAGHYKLRFSVGALQSTEKKRHFVSIGAVPAKDQFNLLDTFQVSGTVDNPQVIEVPVQLSKNGPRKFAVRERGDPKAMKARMLSAIKETGLGLTPALWIDWVEWEGPLPSAKPKMFKQRREVEKYATAKVKRKYESYFKAGYDAALAFQKDGIPRPAVGVKDLDEAKFRIRRYEMEAASQLRYLNDPLTKSGSLLGVFDRNGNLNSEEFIEISMDPLGFKKKSKPLPLGKYRVRVRMGSVEGTSPDRHFAVLGSVSNGGSRNVDGDGFNLLETFQVTGTTSAPQVFETTVELTLNGSRKFSLREKSNLMADTLRGKREIYKGGMAAPPALWVDWVEWEGPLQDKVQDDRLVSILQNNLSGTVDTEEERARSIFQRFCVEAFRQVDPDPMFIDQLVGLYKRRITAGDSFDVAIRTPLSVILASPGFLYLDEPNMKESKRPLNDRELAVRLAYFLWSSPPDARLFALAKRNELSNPATLRAEVDRMIADPRSEEFVAGFVHQWLHMERLDFFQFDTKLHREFDESVRASARKEVYESFALLLRDQEGGHIGKLLKSDYVMINGLLGTYYGIDGVNGDHFRKVSLPADSPRGGLLGTAAVLAMGSDGIESSPVERGAWVLRYLLNDPPPPAPPNVPQLSRLAEKPLTARERVLAHQEEPQCASCHRKIDPIGFGLENFTAAGKWRTEDKHGKKTYDIDPSGKFHKGPEFADYFEMRDLIAQKENDFARGFTEHLIGYGLGRPFGFTDEDLANEITSAAKKEDHSVSAFVHALVQSKAFITK